MPSIARVASEPAEIDVSKAILQAQVQYDDAAANRIGELALDIQRELKRMQSPSRARDVRQYAVANMLGRLNTEQFGEQFGQFLKSLGAGPED